ncbi:hypothetical protein Q9K02_08425 [Qipengyuania sp. G39]|uniref:Uncharacterized protein n=1 Tax=Qipengyuania profundimaris TaxID=3067652 RepID=A0ABT9HPV9_9SPHN|nr:hypothetical protein [Qipengyuania sp. G39]MDP4575157.1 hypothetical protein [Qipengyuania sp. G39]
MKGVLAILAALGLFTTASVASAQSDEWFVGTHPEYHAALVRDVDDVFVAIFVPKEPSIYASPLLMETMAPACDTKQPVGLHATMAIMAFGDSAEERLAEVRRTVQDFYDRSVRSCPPSDDFEVRFFHRFDDAYLATDKLLVEAGIFPLDPIEGLGRDEQEDVSN